MSEESIKRVLVELDSLLDTRIATVARMNSAAAVIMLDGRYQERDIDDFKVLTNGLIDNEAFDKQYSERDRETLKLARLTNIIKLIQFIVRETEIQKETEPFTNSLSIDVNLYPYILDSHEKELIVDMLTFYVGVEVYVSTVFYPLDAITPSFIKDKYSAVIIYQFNKWFELHAKELNNIMIPRNMIFAPALLIKKPEEYKEMVIEGAENYTPFNLLEMSLVDRLKLEMLKPSEFSILSIEKGT